MKDPTAQFQLPPPMSHHAEHIDQLYTWIWWLSVAFTVGITFAIIWWSWKYRKRPGHKAEPTGHNLPLEIGWTVAPVVVLVILFHTGFKGYMELSVAPEDSEEIQVQAQQWSWAFTYKNGIQPPPVVDENKSIVGSEPLHLPVKKPVKFVMQSSDVLHAMYIPEFRVKRDVIPGMYTNLWFTPMMTTKVGGACKKDSDCSGDTPDCDVNGGVCRETVNIFCAEYCGGKVNEATGAQPGHYSMLGKAIIESEEDYDKYLKKLEDGMTPEKKGAAIFASTCSTCHTVDGTIKIGPSWKGLWGRTEKMDDGAEVQITGDVGRNYIQESIYNPNAKIVAGFDRPSKMSPFSPQQIGPDKINAIIAYMKTLSANKE